MKLVYFAWVRERIGKAEEDVALPAEVDTVADLLRWLAGARRGICATPSRIRSVIRAAIDRKHVEADDAARRRAARSRSFRR